MPIGNPGIPGANLPAGEDWVPRRFADLERQLSELQASVTRIGLIDNAALTSPLMFSAEGLSIDAFSLPLAETPIATVSLTVPNGFTTAVVQGIGSVFVYNSTATLDYLYARVNINWAGGSAAGRRLMTALGAYGGSGSLSVNMQQVITGLVAGQVITVTVAVRSAFATLPAEPSNGATVNAMVTWARN